MTQGGGLNGLGKRAGNAGNPKKPAREAREKRRAGSQSPWVEDLGFLFWGMSRMLWQEGLLAKSRIMHGCDKEE